VVAGRSSYAWVSNTGFSGQLESVDFWESGRPRVLGNLAKTWGAKPPHPWMVSRALGAAGTPTPTIAGRPNNYVLKTQVCMMISNDVSKGVILVVKWLS